MGYVGEEKREIIEKHIRYNRFLITEYDRSRYKALGDRRFIALFFGKGLLIVRRYGE